MLKNKGKTKWVINESVRIRSGVYLISAGPVHCARNYILRIYGQFQQIVPYLIL